MADTYWDPANLLQITFDSSPDAEIQCIGQTWRNNGARCRWTVPDPAAIHDRLTQMSRKSPQSITTREVEDLASRCLCAKYHAGQFPDTMSRWRAIIGRAIREQKRLAGAATIDDEAQQLRVKLLESTKEVSRRDAESIALKDELSSAKSESGNLGRKLKHALDEIDERNEANNVIRLRWQESLDNEERCKSEVASARSDLTAQRKEAEEQACAIRTKLEKAQADQQSTEMRLKEAEECFEQEKERHEETTCRLHAEETRHKEMEERLALESATLRQTRFDLEATQQLNKLLEDKLRSLEATQAALETSIDACWLHGLCAWVRDFAILPGLLRSRWKPLNEQDGELKV